jgi:hypothetical protein
MFGLFTAGLAAFAPLVAAYTTPTGTEPKGNPIALPGLDTIVPAGQDYKITWDPTTQGTVSLILLKGPAENLQFVEAIAEKIPNSGSYSWNVESSLVASEGAKGYGIQLIDDATSTPLNSASPTTPPWSRLLPPRLLLLLPTLPLPLPTPLLLLLTPPLPPRTP